MNSPFTLIGLVEETNLLAISWNVKSLAHILAEWKLKDREAVIFTNKNQDRFRIVAKFYGMPVLILPPVDPKDQLSLYLKVHKFLAQFQQTTTIRGMLDIEMAHAKEKLQERKEKALKAQEVRSSENG